MTEFTKIVNEESLWGELYEPVRPKLNTGSGLRVVLFVSCNCGDRVIQQLSNFEQKYKDKLNIVGVATDDPIDPNARISLKKRIWNHFTPAERQDLKFKLIQSCMDFGISCYTGSVKTDYFRKIYKAWNPEALIMFCYGQKLDSFIFDFPDMGAYNLHPSDLPKKIGAGTQPFQNAIRNGLKTSPLVIHEVTEIIDIGPIVGVSPPINICLEDGGYPSSILTLLEKLTSIGGWMSVQLVAEMIDYKAKGKSGPVHCINYFKLIPPEMKEMMMSPATNDLNEKYELPLHPLLLT